MNPDPTYHDFEDFCWWKSQKTSDSSWQAEKCTFGGSNQSKSPPSSSKHSSSSSLMDNSTSLTITNNRYDIGPIYDDTDFEYDGHPHLFTDDIDISIN